MSKKVFPWHYQHVVQPAGIAILALIFSVVPSNSAGQVKASYISGTITDPDRKLGISEVMVKATLQGAESVGESRPNGTLQPIVLTAESDSKGEFRLAVTKSGRYSLTVDKSGYSLPPFQPANHVIEISANPTVHQVGIEMVQLGSITGIILDKSGKPKPSITVEAIRPYYNQGRWVLSTATLSPLGAPRNVNPYAIATARTQTDELGRFHLFGLFPGRYYLAVTRDLDPPQYYPGVPDPTDSDTIEIKNGNDEQVNFHLREIPVFSLRFRIKSPKEPSVGDSLQIIRRSANGMETLEYVEGTGHGLKLASTFEQIYETQKLPNGQYELFYAADRDTQAVGSLIAEIRGNDSEAGMLNVDSPVSFGGHINKPQNLDLGSNMRVQVVNIGSGLWTPPLLPPVVTSNGTFVFQSKVRRLPYWLSVVGIPPGYCITKAEYGGIDVLQHAFIPDDSNVDGIQITIGPSGNVSGTVTDQRGYQSKKVTVVLIPPQGLESNPTEFRSALTNSEGSFEFQDIRPGSGYRMFAISELAPGVIQNSDVLSTFVPLARELTVSPYLKTSLSLRLLPGSER